MADRSCGWSRRLWALGATLVLVPAIGLAARDEPSAKGEDGPPAITKAQRREAVEILQALRELYASVMTEEKAPEAASGLPERPKRTVKPPTIDPAEVDSLLDRTLAAAKVQPARLTTDEEFVRRVYLDVTGTLPEPRQVVEFVRDKAKDKRARLIDRLLDSPGYATNWARYWRDVIRFHAANENIAQVGYPSLVAWLSGQLAENRPWDEIATALISATGRVDENGATAFTIAQMAQPVELAGEVSRVFLGVQIQCAQCHDHPNDPWKREQFHEFAAFFAGTRSRRADAKAKGQGPPVFEVAEQAKARYKMPDLKDPKKQIPVAPRFFLASQSERLPESLTPGQRRALAASYVTGQDNPWFARAFVNRTWAALMGEGFSNPVDDLGPNRKANAPEVLDALAVQWQQGGYDIKWLFRTILNTRAYQRESRATNTAAGRTPFASNCPGRLPADQVIDALAHALDLNLDGPGGQGQGKKSGQAKVKKVVDVPKGLPRGPRVQLNGLFGVDPSTPTDEVLGTIPQALFLMNSPQVNKAIKVGNGTVLGEVLASSPDDRAAVEALYLRVLARHPSGKELSVCGRYIEAVGDRREAYEDILWSLINSTEFLSRR